MLTIEDAGQEEAAEPAHSRSTYDGANGGLVRHRSRTMRLDSHLELRNLAELATDPTDKRIPVRVGTEVGHDRPNPFRRYQAARACRGYRQLCSRRRRRHPRAGRPGRRRRRSRTERKRRASSRQDRRRGRGDRAEHHPSEPTFPQGRRPGRPRKASLAAREAPKRPVPGGYGCLVIWFARARQFIRGCHGT